MKLSLTFSERSLVLAKQQSKTDAAFEFFHHVLRDTYRQVLVAFTKILIGERGLDIFGCHPKNYWEVFFSGSLIIFLIPNLDFHSVK